ncbi:HU family DNA-binding protein [Persephonella sp.]|uniref:HU family DNA-binding protein n=1 Tax=Persephonella sp. TaxID=2060922 RepID=UPI0025E6D763|nr:HU family DNA-binding protein [Persephonella sp.]
MKKSDIIEMLLEEFPELDRKTVTNIVNGTFEAMMEALTKGQKIEIRGLGTFRVKSRPAKVARNPKTGEKIKIPPKKVVHFKIGKVLKAKLNARAGV